MMEHLNFTKVIAKKKGALTVIFLAVILMSFFYGCQNVKTVTEATAAASVSAKVAIDMAKAEAGGRGFYEARKSNVPVLIDGSRRDAIWAQANWYSMNYLWMGNPVDSADYYGRFKLAWDKDYLYVLAEITDDYLNTTLKNGVDNYWKGDYVEVFIDEDKSGGNHQFNHQAFAYHVSTEGHAIDKNSAQQTVFFDNHVDVQRVQKGNKYIWEMAIKLFDDQFNEKDTANVPEKIFAQKTIGFSMAYGDNDGNNSRENFMGSKKTHGYNNDVGYINSDVFGTLEFID